MHFIHRRLLIWVLSIVRHPKITLLIALLTVAACAILAKAKLNISTDQNKLFSPDVPFFHDYLSFIHKFPENEAIYIVLQPRDPADPPPVKQWTAAADAITAKLRAMPDDVRSVDDRVPIDQLGTQGILFDDRDRIEQSLAEARQFIPLARLVGEKPPLLERTLGATPLARLLGGLNIAPAEVKNAGFLKVVARSLDQTLRSTGPPTLPDLVSLDATDPSRLGYYYVKNEEKNTLHPDQHLLLVRVYPNSHHTSLTDISNTVEAIRSAAVDATKAFPDFIVGTTGRPALEADEMRTTDIDSHHAEIVALIVVFIGLSIMLRSLWLALVAEIALACGIGWTFGWATVSIGELNLLSIVFLIALIGIGMDYLVQILTRYRREAQRYVRAEAIWTRVFANVSAPINTACFGAAGAFLVSIFTHFPGTQQLGVIAGGGLLLCLLAGYTVLPAILVLLPPPFKHIEASHRYAPPPARVPWFERLVGPVLWMLLVLAGIPLAMRVGFDPGLLDLQAPNLESVKLVNTLQTWYAVDLSKNLSTLRKVRDAVENDPNVAYTDSVLKAIDNQAFLDQPANQLPAINWTPPPPVPAGEIASLAERCTALANHYATVPATAPDATADAAHAAVTALRSVASILGQPRADHAHQADRLTAWQTAFVKEVRDSLAKLHPDPLDVRSLPPQMRGHYISADGTYALYIYPVNDLWNRQNLQDFDHAIQTLISAVPDAPPPTGIAINVLYSTSGIRGSFIHATLYALCLIVLLVFLDLRRIDQTLLAISVLALGLPMLIAIMGLLHMQWNFANFFGLPILIGAGHEYGVFLVHRYRESLTHPRRVWRGWDVSDRALLLCAFVTTSSFAFFWLLGHHRGLRSLGLVMAIGTACIYGAAICVLQPILKWRLARR